MRRGGQVAGGFLAVLLLVLAGCGGDSGTDASRGDGQPDGPGSNEASLAKLIAAADLPPCPPSTRAEPVEDGLPGATLDCLGEGPPVTLSGLRGKPLVLNVWASWCDPCEEEMPRLARAHQSIGNQVMFLGVNMLDERGYGLGAADSFGMTFPSVVDPEGTVKRDLRIPGLPATFFVTADGRVAHAHYGEITSDDQLGDLMDEHLGVRP